jgi:hypothetical protein
MTFVTGILLIISYLFLKWLFRYINLFLFGILLGKMKEQTEKNLKEKLESLKGKGAKREDGENV